MKVISLSNLLVTLCISQALYAQSPKASSQPVTETFFGKQVTDPYRNLENLSDSTVMDWHKAQAAYAEEQLNKLPLQKEIFKELKELNDQFSYQINAGQNLVPVFRENKIFYVKTLAGEQTGKFYYRQEDNDNDMVIFDPNKNNHSGIPNVISGFSVNDEGSKAGVIVTSGGNEVGWLYIIDPSLRQPVDSIDRVWWPANWQGSLQET